MIGGFALGQPGIVLAEDALALIAPEGTVPTESAAIPVQKALMEGTTPTIPSEVAAIAAAWAAENTTNVEQLVGNTNATAEPPTQSPGEPPTDGQSFVNAAVAQQRILGRPFNEAPPAAQWIAQATNAQDALLYAGDVLPGAGGVGPPQVVENGPNDISIYYPDGSRIYIFPNGETYLRIQLADGGQIRAWYRNGAITNLDCIDANREGTFYRIPQP